MILKPSQVVDQLAPHWIAAAVNALITAGGVAANSAQASAARRAQANAAQSAKHGLAAPDQSGNVSGEMLGGLSQAAGQASKDPTIQNKIQSLFKKPNQPGVATDSNTAIASPSIVGAGMAGLGAAGGQNINSIPGEGGFQQQNPPSLQDLFSNSFANFSGGGSQ
jgi:hypothetical protein